MVTNDARRSDATARWRRSNSARGAARAAWTLTMMTSRGDDVDDDGVVDDDGRGGRSRR